jgi:ferredoxin-NADP reductase
VILLPQVARYRIASIEKSVHDVSIFRLEPLEGKVPPFTPGQAVFLHILGADGATLERKPYSVASGPDPGHIELCIKMIHGRLTGKLEKLGVGAVVGIEGPMGHFVYNGQAKAAFIGGGTGVAPFMSMLRHIAASGKAGTFVLFYSVRDRQEIIYREELERLSKANPGIKVVTTLTREEPSDWAGECGRINHEMLVKHIGQPGEFEWWICGPAEMVKSMRVCIAGMGADLKKLHMEAWG